MLARDAQAQILAIKAQDRRVMRPDHVAQRRALRDLRRGRAVKCGGDLGQDPRATLRAAPHHHALCARLRQRALCAWRIDDIAIGDDGNGDRVADRADRGPIGLTLVELTARASVDGDHLHPCAFGARGDLGRVQHRIIPAQPCLERDRHLDRPHHRRDQGQRMVRIAHQRRAGIAIRHLFGGATHVDVDDGGTLRFGDAGGLGHPMGLAARDLHGGAACIIAQLGACAHRGLGHHHLGACHHLGHHKTRPEARNEVAKGPIRYARHWRQQDRRRKRDIRQLKSHVLNPCALSLWG